MNLARQKIPSDVSLEKETETVAHVICNRCHNKIGRLQTVPAEPDADEEEIFTEIRLIADEHRPLCSKR